MHRKLMVHCMKYNDNVFLCFTFWYKNQKKIIKTQSHEQHYSKTFYLVNRIPQRTR